MPARAWCATRGERRFAASQLLKKAHRRLFDVLLNEKQDWNVSNCPICQGSSQAAKGRRRAAIIEVRDAAKAARGLACPWRNGCADRHSPRRDRGPGPESRSGQIGDAVVCGQLRDVPSQPARPCQGPLAFHVVRVPERTLLDQFGYGGGARYLSGVGRHATKQPIARCRRKTVASQKTPAPGPSACLIHAIELRRAGN
jgi:hypothetical protein